jgi:hypothetical protein
MCGSFNRWIDLSHRMAEFNMSLALPYAASDVATTPDRVYSRKRND